MPTINRPDGKGPQAYPVEKPMSNARETWQRFADSRLIVGRDNDIRDAAMALSAALESAERQLAAAQAVIAVALEWGENVLAMEDALALRHILSRWPADALQAHDRQVAAKSWDEGASRYMNWDYDRDEQLAKNPYRAAAIVSAPSTPEQGECGSCGEDGTEIGECPKSRRPCGHHCNHIWTHDECDWCGYHAVAEGSTD